MIWLLLIVVFITWPIWLPFVIFATLPIVVTIGLLIEFVSSLCTRKRKK